MSWADLPPDLLRLISGNLHEVGDLARFLSVCQAWRDTAPPAPLPQFLPWLLAPRGKYSPSIARFRSVFSNTTTTTTWCAPGTYSRRTMWLSTEDGTAMWSLTSEAGPSQSPLRVVDPFTGAATALPPFAREIGGYKLYYTDGFVLADGTFVLYGVEDLDRMGCAVTAAMLRPGDTAWMEGGALLIVYPGFCGGSAATYHDGEIVLVDLLHVDTVKLRITRGGGNIGDVLDVTANTTSREDPPWSRSPGPQPRRTYTFKSRGELLVACLLVQDMAEQDGGVDQPRALAGAMSVSVFALEEPEEVAGDGVDIIRRWVKRDGRSLGDRVLFLGCPTSFAVDAARFGGAISGGCAYLVLSSQQNAGWSRRNVPETCRVYRYSFEDGSATVVEELPTGAGWDDDANMTWVVPRPSAIAPVHEIRERLVQDPKKQRGDFYPRSIIRAPRRVLGPQFRIFLGNLPTWLYDLDLNRFFARFGKVADARIICDRRRSRWGFEFIPISYTRSWGFGFVTMATIDEPADFFDAMDGQEFFGHVLRVKFTEERPNGPFVMPLLAQKFTEGSVAAWKA